MDIVIPNLGDIDEVEVIELCVAEGDTVTKDQSLIVIESDKASMDVPSPEAGKLTRLAVAVGDMVSEGDLIGTLDSDSESEAEAEDDSADDSESVDEPPDEAADKTEDASETSKPPKSDGEGEQPEKKEEAKEEKKEEKKEQNQEKQTVEVLVPDIGDAQGVVVIELAVTEGSEVEVDDLLVVLESDKASMEITAEQAGKVIEIAVAEGDEVEQGTKIAVLEVSAAADDSKDTGQQATPQKSDDDSGQDTEAESDAHDTGKEDETPTGSAAQVYAGPAVRRLARELGVDLRQVDGSGNRKRIVKDDVKAFVKQRMQSPDGGAGASWPRVPEVDFAKFGEVEQVELSRIRRRGAENLHKSWVNLPHVTQHDEVDVTDLEAFRKSLKAEAERKEVKLTPLSFIVQACCRALREYPEFNASLHPDGKHLVVKQYINIGMAVDTPEGLLVPVIRDADRKSVWELSDEIATLSANARDRKLGLNDLQGGTFSVSSLGALGGTGFTPIVNAPEVAILGVARLQTKPLWDGEHFQPRQVLPLSLSYDHRVVNGADGGRFMQFLTMLLGDIRRLTL